MNKPSPARVRARPVICPRQPAFTILEVLAATAVLAMLFVIFAQIASHTLNATRTSSQKLDAAGRARTVLDALNNDLQSLADTNNLTICYKRSATGDHELAFLTHRRPPVTVNAVDFRVLAVTYRLNGDVLERVSAPVDWDKPLTNLVLDHSLETVTPLAEGILRFEAVAVLDDGSIQPLTPSSATWNTSTLNDQPIPDEFHGMVLSQLPTKTTEPRVKSLIVAVITLDQQSMELPGIPALIALLREPAISSNQTPYEVWNALVYSGSLSGFPQPAVATLHISQRTYMLR